MFRSFPLLLVALIVYNLIAAAHGFDYDGTVGLLHKGVDITMFSGKPWTFTIGDLVVLVALALLFVEVVKSTRTGATEIINHALSMLVVIIAVVEFIAVKACATSPFFFLTAMTVFDITAGFTISIVAARRDLGEGGALFGSGN